MMITETERECAFAWILKFVEVSLFFTTTYFKIPDFVLRETLYLMLVVTLVIWIHMKKMN